MKKYFFHFFLLTYLTIQAQDPIVLQTCRDAVVTCASSFNDPTVAGIKQLGDNSLAPMNGTNWNVTTLMPVTWRKDSIGQIFGTTIDDIGNVYFGATAMYANGMNYNFSKNTYPTQALMNGSNYGYHSNGGPGGIYKSDATDLNITNVLVSSISNTSALTSGVGTNRIINNGYGIGNLAFSKTGNKIYATNLEDGTIIVADAVTGNIAQIYDPFIADNNNTNIAPLGERLFGIAVQNVSTINNNRVYYARLKEVKKSEIYSVEIDASGIILPATNTLEIQLTHLSNFNAVTDIAFSERGELLLSAKGDAHKAAVYKYVGDHNSWSFQHQLNVGEFGTPNANSAGGVDFGPKQQDNSNNYGCDSLIWSMTNAISLPTGGLGYYGVTSQPLSGYTANTYSSAETIIADLDGSTSANVKGRFGDVEFFACECNDAFNEICDDVDVELIPIVDTTSEQCCYTAYVTNTYHNQFFTGLHLNASSDIAITSVTSISDTSSIAITDPHSVSLNYFNGTYMPTTEHDFVEFKFCIDADKPSNIKFEFIGTKPQNDTVCVVEKEIEACKNTVLACAVITDYKIECKNGIYTMNYTVTNNADFTMRGITVYNQDSVLKPVNKFQSIPDLLPDSSITLTDIPLQLDINFGTQKQACFLFSACDVNVDPLLSGVSPDNCCIDSVAYCADIPECGVGSGGCYGYDMEYKQKDGDDCCFELSLNIAQVAEPISCLKFKGQAGAQFALFSGWNIQPGVTSNQVTVCSPGAYLNPGSYSNFADFCLTGYAQNPYIIDVEYIDTLGQTICYDTLNLDSHCDLVEPSCINFTDYSLECVGDSTVFTFSVHNNSDFDVKQFEIRNTDTNFTLTPTLMIPDSAIKQTEVGGPYQLIINQQIDSDDDLCLYLTAHNEVYDTLTGTAATMCCTDSIGSTICLEVPDCSDEENLKCCTFETLTIPNGITPNGDQVNDTWVIKGLDKCEPISVTIFNRWGNEVYQSDNYTNNWYGTNNNGTKLLQGTYYVRIELPNGSFKFIYIDLRY